MRALVTCVILAVLASCNESQESCEDRGGIWTCGCQPAECCEQHCNERTPDAGKPCTGYKDCAGACEASGGFGGDEGFGGGAVGHCCDHEGCLPRWTVEDGRVGRGPIP